MVGEHEAVLGTGLGYQASGQVMSRHNGFGKMSTR